MNNDEKLKEHVQAQFGQHAEKYVNSETHAKGSDLDALMSWLDPAASWKVLDIATGGGHVAKRLSPHVQHVVATDLTPLMLTAARTHLDSSSCSNVTFVIADAERLPFLDASFDAVTCRIAAHHFPHPDRFLKEAARVLRPGGKLVLIDNIVPEDAELGVFMNTFEAMRDYSHVRCLPVSEWQTLAAAAGLHLEQSQSARKTHNFPDWVRRTLDDEEQISHVERYISEAGPHMHDYFSVHIDHGAVQSLEIDDWRALFSKS